MSYKIFTQGSILVMFLAALLGTPISAQAGGVCGGTYIVEKGQTLDSIAAICGTSVSAIIAANPGISTTVSTGQSLTVPGSTSTTPGTAVPSTPVQVNNYYNTYNYYNYSPSSVGYNGTYTVQLGDTFSGIALRFGVSVNALWAANPNIWDINLLYAGQVLNIPTSSGVAPSTTNGPDTLSYGTVPYDAPMGKVKLSPNTSSEIYVSLQGTTRDGNRVINEYTVNSGMTVKVPAGWYIYVAWVGGQKFTGQFNLGGDSSHTISFYDKKVVVE